MRRYLNLEEEEQGEESSPARKLKECREYKGKPGVLKAVSINMVATQGPGTSIAEGGGGKTSSVNPVL